MSGQAVQESRKGYFVFFSLYKEMFCIQYQKMVLCKIVVIVGGGVLIVENIVVVVFVIALIV
jgi:hypothetical protein